jgi:zinc and cadmium transporter
VTTFSVIVLGSLLMSVIALVGAVTIVLPPRRLQQLLIPLVSLAAGSLMGGALFHMIPESYGAMDARVAGFWVGAGFTSFLGLEIVLHWHHSHRNRQHGLSTLLRLDREPLALLILIGDALHNFICGIGIAGTYLIDPASGVAAWLAAAAHEIPQELGDFGVLLHSGWSRRRALAWNFISALSFPLGALLAWRFQAVLPLAPLVLLAAGNFLYIAASDLVPEIKAQDSLLQALTSFSWFAGGLLVLWLLASV